MARQPLNTSCRAKSNTALTGSLTRFARPIAISAFTAAAAMLTSVALTGRAAAQTWGTAFPGNWGDSANWTPATVPNAIDATATFTVVDPVTTSVGLTGGPFTVGTLNLDSSIASSGYSFQGGTLIMDVSSGSAAINVQSSNLAADFAGSATLQLNSNTVITTASSAARLTVDGLVTGAGALTIAGPGTVVLNATNSYAGGTNIAAGALRIGASGALGTSDVTFTGNSTLGANATATLTNTTVIKDGVTATFGAAAGQTLTLNSAQMAIGNGSGIRIGSATDTGTVVFAPGLGVTGGFLQTYEVVGGTLRAGNPLLGGFLARGASTTVDSGATLDMNGFGTGVNTLLGSGTVATGGPH